MNDTDPASQLVEPNDRYPATVIETVHPCLMEPVELLRQCQLRTQRRSGPGGQHRNKTSSGVFLTHEPTGIVAEATEGRSQAANRSVALARLRLRLAVEIRTPSALEGPTSEIELEARKSFVGTAMRLAETNPMKPPLLALLLNDLHATGGQPRIVAKPWQTTATAIVRLIKSHPPAFVLLQAIRKHHGLRPLT